MGLIVCTAVHGLVVCIVEQIGMYWHGMFYGMYWYVICLVCIRCIGMYLYVSKGQKCKYWYVLITVVLYGQNGMYCAYWHVLMCVFVCISLNWPVLDVWSILVCMVFTSLYLYVMICIALIGRYLSVCVCIGTSMYL